MRFLFILAFLLISTLGLAQSDTIQVRSQTFTIADGLSQNMVSCMTVDSRGFLWLGTKDGLNRFDGVDFVHFYHNPENPLSLPNNSVEAIEEDSQGRLWIGTVDGLAVYDPLSQIFHVIPFPEGSGNRKITVCSIAEDPYGNYWLGTFNGVYKVSPHGGQLSDVTTELILPFPDLPEGQYKSYIHVDVASTGFVYMGCNAGFYVAKAEEGFGRDERFRQLSDKSVRALTIDSKNRIWLGNSHLRLYKPIQNIFTEVTPEPSPPTAQITAIEIDPEGNVWYSETDAISFKPRLSRMHKYNPATETITDVRGLKYPATISMAFTKDLLWAGTPGYGVKRVDLKSALFRVYDARTHLAKVYNNPNLNNFFFHKSDPAFLTYRNNQPTTFDVITKAPLDPAKLSLSGLQAHIPAFYNNNFPSNAVIDGSGHIWHFALKDKTGHRQLVELDSNLKEIKRKSFDYSFVNLIYFDMSGNLWFSSQDRLLQFNKDTWTITEHTLTAPGEEIVVNNLMLSDSKGDFWLGSDHGLKRYNPVSGKLTSYSVDHPELRYSILSILNDPFSPEEYLWVGTEGGGLVKLHKPSGRTRQYTLKDGLPNLVIYGILPDERGNIWLSTNKGISRLDTQTDTFTNFSREDGLPGNEFNRFMYGILNDGRLWFESLKGIVAFDPLRVNPDTLPPQMVFTQVKNFNSVLSPALSPERIDKPASFAEQITLPWDDNVVSFSYTALDFRAPDKIRFSTRMEGVDKDWSPPMPERTTTYANLAPGDYTFRVRASNSNGYWNKEGISIKLTILTPWWRSPLAYILYAILIAAVLYSLYKIRINRIRLQFTLNDQRQESDRLQEVDRLKNEFFSNITHEFRTPITLIINPIHRLMNKSEDPVEHTELRRIHRNANQLLRLINQLLDLSKIDSGMMRIEPARGEVVNFVQEIVDSFAPLASSKNIMLIFQSSEPKKECHFDPSALEKITYNLISNAIKYTGKNGKVDVNLIFRKRKNTFQMTLEVTDNGSGIEAVDQDRIFDRYYRSQSTHAASGTGIGLALVREITILYGGEISLQSIPGTGSTFRVELPLASSANSVNLITQPMDATPVDEFEDDALPESIAEDDKPVVLVVEDNDDLRSFIQTCLAPHYTVIEATNGQEAIDIATQSIPDAVVSDVMMPVMDGMKFLELIKTDERTSHIPVILLTAKTNRQDREAALSIGADAFLTKPFYESELIALLNNLLNLRTQTWNLYRSHIIKIHNDDQTTAEEAFVQKLRNYIETNIADQNISVDHLCKAAAMSRTQLHRKLKAITGQPTGTFIRMYRLEKARQLIEVQNANISEVAYQTGFSTHSYFSKCFAEAYGMSPMDYQKQFR